MLAKMHSNNDRRPVRGSTSSFAGTTALLLMGAFTLVAAAPAENVDPPMPTAHAAPVVAASGPDGAALYANHCSGCHDNATDRTPTHDVLAKNPPSFIMNSLKSGAMAPMAAGLSDAEMMAIARHVSTVSMTKADGDVDPKMIWGDGVEGTPLDAPRCAQPPMPVDLSAKNQWNGWSPSVKNAHYQAQPDLAVSDVPRLKLKWAFQYPGAKNGQATVVGDRLFTTSMSGAVYALNAKTGCVYWRHAAGAATRTSVALAALPKGSAAKTALFYSDWTKSVVAIDADTGKPLWKTVVDDQPGLQMTGSLTYWEGKIFVPISSGNEAFAQSPNWICCKFRGAIVTLDAATGKILWKRYTTEAEPKPFKVNSAGKQVWGPSGGAIWVAPTIDAKRRAIYVGTSNSYTDVRYDNADSVLAIDVDSGKIRWARQLTPDDNYIDGCYRTGAARPVNCPKPVGPDFSIGATLILHDLPGGSDIILVGQKSGNVFGVNPIDGKIVWKRALSEGSALGGIEFGLAADNERVYAAVSDIVLGAKGNPGLWALDPATGNVIWSAPNKPIPTCRWKSFWCHGATSQAITVIPGAVFAGAYDGHFRAYDPVTGKIIWDVDTGKDPVRALNNQMVFGGVMDGGGPTVAGGMVYVHSGYAGRSGATKGANMREADGNVLMAFSVDGL